MRILIIDPSNQSLKLYEELFSLGHEVTTKVSGLNAIYFLMNNEPPDIIIISGYDPYSPNGSFERILKNDPQFESLKIITGSLEKIVI